MSKEAMKRFLIETSVERAEGSQTWYVDATSEAEALKKYEQGEADIYASNVDVTSLGEPEISSETTLDDFGDFAEQPAQQEPVGEVNRYGLDSHGRKWHGIYWYDPNVDVPHGTKLYTQAQRTWVGLTDDEIYMNCPNWLSQEQCKVWIQQIEAKLKEKNNGN